MLTLTAYFYLEMFSMARSRQFKSAFLALPFRCPLILFFSLMNVFSIVFSFRVFLNCWSNSFGFDI